MIARKDPFTPKMYGRLFLPAVLTSVGLAFSDMADAIVVGSRMGEIGLAAIGMALPLYMIINVLMHGFGIGGSVAYSHLLGEGREKEATDSFNRVMRMSVLVSILLAALVNIFPEPFLKLLGTEPADGELYQATLSYVRIIALGSPLFFLSYILNYYLRNDNRAGIAGIGFLIGNALDIILNFVLVIAFDFGTTGAAWATLIGLVVTVSIYSISLFSKKNVLTFSWKPMKPHFKETFKIFAAGFSTSSQYLYQLVFLLIANNVLMHHMGEGGVAVFDMIQNASFLLLYLYDGAAKALQPLASTLYGEKNMEAVGTAKKCALTSGLIVGAVAIALVCIFPTAICSVFGLTDGETVKMGVDALRIFCMGASFAGISVILESYYQSAGAEKSAFMIALFRGGIILIPCTVIFGIFAPEYFWFVFPITETIALLLLLLYRKFRRKNEAPVDDSRVFHAMIHGKSSDISAVTEKIEGFCETFEATMKQQYFVTMSVEEISLAIISGGFEGKKDGLIHITLIALENGDFELHIRDNATSFNPFSLESAKAGSEEGFDMDAIGMTVIKKKSKEFYYRRYQGFNSLVVRI